MKKTCCCLNDMDKLIFMRPLEFNNIFIIIIIILEGLRASML